MKKLLEKNSGWIIPSALALSLVWLHFRVQSILPAIMQDEYVYSMQARMVPLADLQYPNFFYSWVYSLTSQCGTNFYSCTKTLNLVFFAGFVVLIYFLALQWLSKWAAFAIALATALSPLGMFTSLFMPESMYFFFALASFSALLWAQKVGLWWHFALAGAVLGLTSLIKPHALFLLLPVLLFVVLANWKNWSAMAKNFLSYLAAVFLVKFGLGFLLAGASAFTLFGPSYTSSFTSFTENLQGLAEEQTLAMGKVLAVAGPQIGFSSFIGSAIWQFFWQLSAIALISAAAISVAIRGSGKRATTVLPLELVRFNQLALLTLAGMLLVIAAFAAMVTLSGDDHTNRLLLRYYEFLFPILLIGAAATIKHASKLKSIAGYIIAAVGLLIALVGAILWLPNLRQLFADSPTMMGVTGSSFNLAIVLIGLVTAVVFSFMTNKTALSGFLAASLLVSALLGVSSVDRLYSQASKISPADSAGIFARDYLAEFDPGEIYFFGANKQLTLASIFALDKPSVGYQIVDQSVELELSSVPEGVNWVVLLDGIQLKGNPNYSVQGKGWSIERIRSSQHDFSKNMIDSPLASITGLDFERPLGRWNSAGEIVFEFKQPLPANAKIYVEILMGERLANSVQLVRVGDSEVPLQFGEAGQVLSGELTFTNTLPANTLVMKLTDSTPGSIGFLKMAPIN